MCSNMGGNTSTKVIRDSDTSTKAIDVHMCSKLGSNTSAKVIRVASCVLN